MNFQPRRLLPALILVPVIAGLAACSGQFPGFSAGADCNGTGGCSANYSQSPTARARTSVPAQPSTPAPPSTPAAAVTVTATPAPLPQPTVIVTTTTYVNIGGCVPLDEVYLDSLAASPYGTSANVITLAQCLQIPQGNQQTFEDQVMDYALIGQQSGLFSTRAGRENWLHGNSEVLCPDGRQIYSLYRIYLQYG